MQRKISNENENDSREDPRGRRTTEYDVVRSSALFSSNFLVWVLALSRAHTLSHRKTVLIEDNHTTKRFSIRDTFSMTRKRQKIVQQRKTESLKNRRPSATLPMEEVVASTPTSSINQPHLDESEDENDSCEAHDHMEKSDRCPRKAYFLITLCFWILEISLVIMLKRMGILNQDFRLSEAVLETVLPKIDEAASIVLPHINESLDALSQYSMAGLPDRKVNVGLKLAQQGATAKYPIIIIPGFVTSGLEVWSGKECVKGFFRQRLWATLTAARSFLVERECWKAHMMLDPITGEDPDDIRVRASEGFAATDYFMANYWVFAKMVENLAEVGYTTSLMEMAPYDWRLAFPILEKRDGFFTSLKYRIEAKHKTSGKKVVLVTHSMGSMVIHHFFGWVTTPEKHGGGGGGRKWVDKHVQTYINIAGAHLGVAKAATALLSGEMSDVVFTGRMEKLIEQFFGRKLRRDLWSSWGSLWAMLPKGGEALWGPGSDMCPMRYPDDPFCSDKESAISPLVAITESPHDDFHHSSGKSLAHLDGNFTSTLEKFINRQEHNTEELISFLQKYGSGVGSDNVGTRFVSQFGNETNPSRSWYDVTRQPLPYAPKMKIFCFYGTGLATERAYYYKRNWGDFDVEKSAPNILEPVVILNTTIANEERNVSYGIKYSDGDGSVPLLSLGYMCADAWQREDSGLNPSMIKVFTREYKHRSEFCVDDPMRGGPGSSDHVDILGNDEMMEDFLKIVTDFKAVDVEQDRIVSDIKEISRLINNHPNGGLFRKQRKNLLPWL